MCQHHPHLYLVTELMQTSLQRLLHGAPIPLETRLRIAVQVCVCVCEWRACCIDSPGSHVWVHDDVYDADLLWHGIPPLCQDCSSVRVH